MLIRTLAIHGFKSLMQDQPTELGRVNCFIGANGVGKSNLLEALGVLWVRRPMAWSMMRACFAEECVPVYPSYIRVHLLQ